MSETTVYLPDDPSNPRIREYRELLQAKLDRLAAIERSVTVVEHRLTMAPEKDYSREQAAKDLRAILNTEHS